MNEIIKEKVEKVLLEGCKELSLQLINFCFEERGEDTYLNVSVDKDYSISMEDIYSFSSLISPMLDKIEELSFPYMLNVYSGGYERKIEYSELNNLLNRYLDIKLKDHRVLTCKVDKVEDEQISLFYFIKGRKKKEIIKKENIEEIHMSYKD